MSNQNNTLLISLVNSQAKTVEVYGKLLPYLENQIKELSNTIHTIRAENAKLLEELSVLRNPEDNIEDSKDEDSKDNIMPDLM